jgi:phosphoribosylamine--glycine ligase
MAGVVDVFAERGLLVFGPSRLAARLEGSKVFSKNLMRKYGIPTADFQVFEDMQGAVNYVHSCMQKGKKRLVVKVDGLAAGKGVVVAQNEEEALRAVENMMAARAFGAAGDRVIIEECLVGEEVSVFALADGENVVYLGAAQDHKRNR